MTAITAKKMISEVLERCRNGESLYTVLTHDTPPNIAILPQIHNAVVACRRCGTKDIEFGENCYTELHTVRKFIRELEELRYFHD